MPFDRSPAAAGSASRRGSSGRYVLVPGHQAGRALVATLAGTIAVLGSVAGSTAFVMQSMKSAPEMSVTVAPVITLRPAAPKRPAAGPTVSAGNGPVATPAPSIPAPATATAGAGAQLAAPALRSAAIPALTNRLLAAARVPAVVHRAVSIATGAVVQASAAAKPVTAAAAKPLTAAAAKPLTAAAAKPLTTAAIALPSTIPVVAGPRLAKVPIVHSLDFVTPPPLVAPLAVAAAHARVHRAEVRAHSVGDHSARATVALSQIDSARKIRGGGHRLWAETDGLNGPSTHH